jgi:DNA repair protein RadC
MQHTPTDSPEEPPRERLLRRGSVSLSDDELLAVVLGGGRRSGALRVLATQLLEHCGGLAGILGGDAQRLAEVRGIGPGRQSVLLAARELGLRAAEEPLRDGDVLASPRHTRLYLQRRLGGRQREVFCCLFLDAQHRLLHCEELFLGTLDGAAVYPREVAQQALRRGAAALILAHNHPSGVAEPSAADRQITERLCRALALLDIRVLDHIVVGRGSCYSFAEAGLL